MNLRLSDFSIAQKIALACVVPLLGLAAFAGLAVFEARAKTAAAGEVLAATELAEQASSVVHELQKERGMSAGFVVSKGKDFAAELPVQRQAADGRVAALLGAAAATRQAGALGARLKAAL